VDISSSSFCVAVDIIPSPPRMCNPALYSEKETKYQDKFLRELLDANIITRITSPWSAKTKFIPKKATGKMRMNFVLADPLTVPDSRHRHHHYHHLPHPLQPPHTPTSPDIRTRQTQIPTSSVTSLRMSISLFLGLLQLINLREQPFHPQQQQRLFPSLFDFLGLVFVSFAGWGEGYACWLLGIGRWGGGVRCVISPSTSMMTNESRWRDIRPAKLLN
jgi:hypothetical protein